MSISGVASRFACLQDDDSTDWIAPKSKNKNKKVQDASKKQENKPKDHVKAKAQKEAKDLQNLAFGAPKKNKKKKGASSSSTNDGSNSAVPTAQYEEWVQKDKILVEDNFEQQMQEAIMQSKLDFEEKKVLYAIADAADVIKTNSCVNGDVGEDSKAKKRAAKMSKKPTTISLDEFHAGGEKNSSNSPEPFAEATTRPRTKSETPETNFFDELDEAAAKALTREQLLESYRSKEAGSESALVTDYREKLADKEQELQTALRKVIEGKEELALVKKRNKKLCSIMMSGEMKEKAEILVEVEKLRKVKDELSSELQDLHTQLEQERSKVHAIERELGKAQIDPEVVSRVLSAGSPEHRARRRLDSSGYEGLECPAPSCRRQGEGVGQDKGQLVRVVCSSDICTQAPYMHRDCFLAFEEAALQYLKSCGRARNWNDKQRQQNIWSRKGYDLAYKACGCKCGHGHLKKDVDKDGAT